MVQKTLKRLRASVRSALNPIFYYSSITVAGLAATSLPAQEAEEAEAEEVIVTGSRIRTDGMNSPNPVTVVTREEIEMLNPASIVDGLAELPQFNGSFTTENFGVFFFTSPGSGTLNLRGLQGKRTLTLLDSKRVVGSSIFGGPDVNLFPMQLLQTVESVTGGATAAYGTDAVAGAVNFILNKQYEGIRGSVRTGMNEDGEFQTHGIELAGGFALTDKSHVLLSVEKSKQEQVLGRDKAGSDWFQSTSYIDNPDPNAGESPDNPLLIPAPWIVSRNDSLDGIVHFPQLIGDANAARREAFIADYGSDRFAVNPDGSADIFQDGTWSDDDANSLTGGGSGTINDEFSRQFMPENERENYFTYIDYDLTEKLNVHFETIYGKVHNFGHTTGGTNLSNAANQSVGFTFGPGRAPFPRQYAPLIFSGNPYIPDNIQQIMDEEGLDYLTIGKIAHPLDLDRAFQAQDTKTLSLNIGFDYEIKSDGMFNGWLIKGYYQDGKTDTEFTQAGALRQDRAYLAFDAVENADGEIICNVTQYLDAPENTGLEGCVPFNPFGRGQANAAAIDWITGYEPGVPYAVDGYFVNEHGDYDPIYYEYVSGEHKKRVIDLYLENWEISADGVLLEDGLGLGAGPISMAIGYASRDESFQQVVQAPGVNPANDPNAPAPAGVNDARIGRRGISSQIQSSFQDLFFSNVPFAKGQYSVDEAFVEFLVPVVADLPYINRLDVGVAGRWADYESIDEVSSWRFSYTWAVNEELRFRGTASSDVRAPTMAERYDRTGGAAFFIRDYGIKPDCGFFEQGCFQVQVLQSSFGSTNLKPEDAKTYTAGLIYQPGWLEGLSYSMDWYFVKIEDNINQLGASAVVEGCHLDGIESLCQYIIRNGPPSTINPELNEISFILNPYINQDYTIAKGVDFELSYRTEVNFFGGGETMGIRLLGSYLKEQIYNTNGEDTDWVDRFWAPWTATISADYRRGPLSMSLQTRWPGDTIANINRNQFDEEEGRIVWDVANNENKQPMTVNFRTGYRFELQSGVDLNLSLNVQNLFDKSPRIYPDNQDGFLGSVRGREYSLSLGFNY